MGKFCKYCGKELDSGADVCLNCGKKVETARNQNTNSIIKIVLLIVGILILIPLISIVIVIVTSFVTHSARQHTESSVQKICCQQYGGVWKENSCRDPEVKGVEFDSRGYYECIYD